VKTRRIAMAAGLLLGLALLGTALPAHAVLNPLKLDPTSPIPGEPVYVSGTGIPNSTGRIVIIPLAFALPPASVGGGASAVSSTAGGGCYLGSPTALATADVTTDSSGNFGPTLVWNAAAPGSYKALFLQGTCAAGVVGGDLGPQAISDQQVRSARDFGVGSAVPALSGWGLAALGLALSIAGWGFLRTRS